MNKDEFEKYLTDKENIKKGKAKIEIETTAVIED